MNDTPKGKIGRLPKAVWEQVNRRLENGEKGRRRVAWLVPMSFQDEIEARWILGRWQGASAAHIQMDLQQASNAASVPKDQRISLILKANWNPCPAGSAVLAAEFAGQAHLRAKPVRLAQAGPPTVVVAAAGTLPE